MNELPRVLLMDDGDLLRIRKILEGFEVDLQGIRGAVVAEDLEGPFDLVIGTVKQILEFEGIHGGEVFPQGLEAPGIAQLLGALIGPDTQVKLAFRTDLQVLLHVLAV